MKIRKEALAVLGIAAVLASLLFAIAPQSRTAQAAVPGMALDANSSGFSDVTVDPTRSVSGTATFQMGIQVTSAPGAYVGYNWEFAFTTGGLAYVGTAANNTAATGLSSCAPEGVLGSPSPAQPAGTTVEGNGAGCTTFGSNTTQFVGTVTTFGMQCVTDGVFAVTLLDVAHEANFPTDMFDAGGTLSPTVASVTITCTGTGGGVLPTATPPNTATVTNTPEPTGTPTPTSTPCVGASCPTATSTLPPVYTRTPTRTPTGVATAAPATPTQGSTGQVPPPSGGGAGPAGGTRSGIRLPDTGTAGNAALDSETWWMLLGVVGGGCAVAGVGSMMLRRRVAR